MNTIACVGRSDQSRLADRRMSSSVRRSIRKRVVFRSAPATSPPDGFLGLVAPRALSRERVLASRQNRSLPISLSLDLYSASVRAISDSHCARWESLEQDLRRERKSCNDASYCSWSPSSYASGPPVQNESVMISSARHDCSNDRRTIIGLVRCVRKLRGDPIIIGSFDAPCRNVAVMTAFRNISGRTPRFS